MTLDEMGAAYCAAWNEKDEAARSALLETSWGDAGVYEDLMGVAPAGRGALHAHIGGFHQAFPGARIVPTSTTGRSTSPGGWSSPTDPSPSTDASSANSTRPAGSATSLASSARRRRCEGRGAPILSARLRTRCSALLYQETDCNFRVTRGIKRLPDITPDLYA